MTVIECGLSAFIVDGAGQCPGCGLPVDGPSHGADHGRELVTDGGQPVDSTEHKCPGCEEITTFSKGGTMGLLCCDSCGYAPRKSVRDEIRSGEADTDQEEGER